MAKKEDKAVTVTLRLWHLYALLGGLVLTAPVLLWVNATVWSLVNIWLALCLFVVSGFALTVLAAVGYRYIMLFSRKAQAESMTMSVREKQHSMLMECPPEEFERRTSAVATRY